MEQRHPLPPFTMETAMQKVQMAEEAWNNKDLIEQVPADEPIVIADECGDSMWDAVLQQEVKACHVKNTSMGASALLNSIEKRQASEVTNG